MAQMSPNVPPRWLGKALRLKKIKELVPKGSTTEEIAAVCGVNEKTIDRDIKEWRDSGGLEEWLTDEFFSLHKDLRSEEKLEAYKTVAGLLGKTLVQKQRIEVKGEHRVKVDPDLKQLLERYDSVFSEERTVQADDTREQVDSKKS